MYKLNKKERSKKRKDSRGGQKPRTDKEGHRNEQQEQAKSETKRIKKTNKRKDGDCDLSDQANTYGKKH